MFAKISLCLVVAFAAFYAANAKVALPVLRGLAATGPVTVRATENSTVPSVDYIVNGVQTLKQAIEVFSDDANVAKTWAALFKTKYPDKDWNVAVGYTTLYIESAIKVETIVSSGSNSGKKGDKNKGVLYMIFSCGSDKESTTTAATTVAATTATTSAKEATTNAKPTSAKNST